APATKQIRAADQSQDEWFPAALHSARSIASMGSLVVPSCGCEAWAESIRQMKTSVNLQSTSPEHISVSIHHTLCLLSYRSLRFRSFRPLPIMLANSASERRL